MKKFLILLLFFTSCKKDSEKIEEAYSPNNDISKNALFVNNINKIFNDPESMISHSQTLKDFYFTEIRKIEITKKGDFVLLLDEDKIIFLDKYYKFKNIYNKKGRGPGEVIKITDFIVKNDKILIHDNQQNKIIILNIDGDWIKDLIVPTFIMSLSMNNNGNLLVLTESKSNNNFLFTLYNMNGDEIKKIGKLNKNLEKRLYTPNFKCLMVTSPNDNIILYDLINGTMWLYNNLGEYIREFNIQNGPEWVYFKKEQLNYSEKHNNKALNVAIRSICFDQANNMYVLFVGKVDNNYILSMRFDSTNGKFLGRIITKNLANGSFDCYTVRNNRIWFSGTEYFFATCEMENSPKNKQDKNKN